MAATRPRRRALPDDEPDRIAGARAGDEHADRHRHCAGRVIAHDSDPQHRDGGAHALDHTAGDQAASEPAGAQISEPAAKAASEATTRRRRPSRSPSRAKSGRATAWASR